MSAQNAVADFLPSVNGWHFPNSLTGTYPVITIPGIGTIASQSAGNGACGGFSFSARDMYEHDPRMLPPTAASVPAPNTADWNLIINRLLDSLEYNSFANSLKAWAWTATSDHDVLLNQNGLARQMITVEWPAVKSTIDGGHLTPLFIVAPPVASSPADVNNSTTALQHGHQVLAYRYTLDNAGNATIWVYDSNNPDDDNVTISLNVNSDPAHTITVSAPKIASGLGITGIRGFFTAQYAYKDPTTVGADLRLENTDAGHLLSPIMNLTARVNVVSRSADHLDVFATDHGGVVYRAAWQPSFPDGWHGWFVLNQGSAAPGSPVGCVSRAADNLDAFVMGTDGLVCTAHWDPSLGATWQGWSLIKSGRAATGANLTAVSRANGLIDLFVVGTDGGVYTAAFSPAAGWNGWWRIGNAVAPQGAYIGAVSRSADHLDIFVTDTGGNVLTAAWEPDFADGWHGWWQIRSGKAQAGAPVTVVSRSANKLDVFVTGTDGGVYTAAWEPDFADGWHGWSRIGQLLGPQGAYVGAVSRSADHLDIFATDVHGAIQTAAWEPDFAGWHGWTRINGGTAAAGAPVTAVSRSANKLDVFVVGGDSRIYSAAWEPDFADGWHGWWRLG